MMIGIIMMREIIVTMRNKTTTVIFATHIIIEIAIMGNLMGEEEIVFITTKAIIWIIVA